jgi:site-specific recombinase XerD
MLLEKSCRVVQELMGHAGAKTTVIKTHVMEEDISAVLSPLSRDGVL